jgi:hypothetical protein
VKEDAGEARERQPDVGDDLPSNEEGLKRSHSRISSPVASSARGRKGGGRRGDDLGQRSGEGERDMSLAPILHKLPF